VGDISHNLHLKKELLTLHYSVSVYLVPSATKKQTCSVWGE